MPRIDVDAYQPRAGEPAMMTADQRTAACLAYYKDLAAAGDGRLITFGDGSAWFVPNDLDAVAKDIESVLTGKTGGLAGFVLAEALKVVVVLAAREAEAHLMPTKTPFDGPVISPLPEAAADDTKLSRLETLMSSVAEAMVKQTKAIETLAAKPEPVQPMPAPTPQPVTAVAETIIKRLEDEGYICIDHNRPGVSRGPMPFVNLYNGVQVRDREPVIPLATPQQCIEATIEGVHRYAEEAGYSKRLVWRQYPTLGSQDDGYVIRCRLMAVEAPEA